MFSSTDSPTNKQTDKVDLTTNKQKTAEFGTVNLDSSQQRNTGNTEHIDQQEQEHHDDTVPHANTENGRFEKDIITNRNRVIENVMVIK